MISIRQKNEYLKFSKELVFKAGEMIHKFNKKRHKLEIIDKGIEGLATEADEKIEKMIIKEIKKKYPDHLILGEETYFSDADDHFKNYQNAENVWMIDPIDGTNNFINGIPLYSISIAFVNKGESQVGVVFNPVIDELFTAVKGKGAFLEYVNEGRKIKLDISGNKKNISQAIFSTTTIPKKPIKHMRQIKKLNEATSSALAKRRLGSAALELSYVASGYLDGYWGKRLKPWDVAAASLICSEAGAKLSDIFFDKFDVLDSSIIASTKSMAKKIKSKMGK